VPCMELKFNYYGHKSPTQASFMNQMNSVHILILYFFKIHFSIILLYNLGVQSALFPSGFCDCNSVNISQ
jgi:hypothetical protein